MSSNEAKDPNPDQVRFEISQLEKMRAQIMSDMEAMRAQETNLKAFEARIRDSMPPIPFSGSRPSFEIGGSRPAFETGSRSSFESGSRPSFEVRSNANNPNLDAEWEKFQRARALFEAERRGLTDERLLLREERDVLKQREETLKLREEAIKQREAQVAIREKNIKPDDEPPPPKPTSSSPFIAAKNLFGLRRAS